MDWFKKQTKDLLFQKQVPKYNGGGTYWVNQGKLNNTGVELSLTTFPVKGAVTWETSLNASYVKNEVATSQEMTLYSLLTIAIWEVLCRL
mgnify:CR=1 FL=1